MLAIASAAITTGLLTVATIAPFSPGLAILLGPVLGSFAAFAAAIYVAGRGGDAGMDDATPDEETDRLVASLRDLAEQARVSSRSTPGKRTRAA
jgi:hypothetical protein